MQKLIITFLLLCQFFNIAAQSQFKSYSYQIRGTVTGEKAKEITTVYLIKGGQMDSTEVKKGYFVFEGKFQEPGVHNLIIGRNHVQSYKEGFVLFLDKGKTEIRYNANNNSWKAKSKASRDFEIYSQAIKGVNDSMNNANKELRRAVIAKDEQAVSRIQQLFKELTVSQIEIGMKFLKEHMSSPISLHVLMMVSNRVDTIKKLAPIFKTLLPYLRRSPNGVAIKKRIEKEVIVRLGNTIPDFAAFTPSGDKLALSQIASQSKITIVDFWASWCLPCREEIPNLKSIYEKYSKEGLDIVSVSMDHKKEQWVKAIEKDGIRWNNVSELKAFESDVAHMFRLTVVPRVFIIDSSRTVVGLDLSGEDLKRRIDQLIFQSKVKVGNILPEIFSNDTSNTKLALQSIFKKNKLTLIDFWASWCVPCRKQTPHLKQLYDKYQDNGFNILSISFDSEHKEWIKAINIDAMSWDHLSQLKGRNEELGRLLGVNGIPAALLVDQQGKIIALDLPGSPFKEGWGELRGEALEKKLAELLGSPGGK